MTVLLRRPRLSKEPPVSQTDGPAADPFTPLGVVCGRFRVYPAAPQPARIRPGRPFGHWIIREAGHFRALRKRRLS